MHAVIGVHGRGRAAAEAGRKVPAGADSRRMSHDQSPVRRRTRAWLRQELGISAVVMHVWTGTAGGLPRPTCDPRGAVWLFSIRR